MLEGSLDVISAVYTIAIKVSFFFSFASVLSLSHTVIRSRPLDSELNTLRSFNSTPRLINHSDFPFTVMSGGNQPITC